MTRILLQSTAFVRAARRYLKRNPQAEDDLRSTLGLLKTDPFHPQLRTHKLKGDLKNVWSCSAGYDLRVLFEFTKHEGEDAILLLSAGSHDEVY